jgi:hypothetical protein
MHLDELAGITAAWAVTKRIDHLPLLLVFYVYLEMLTRTRPHSVDLERRVIWPFRRQSLIKRPPGAPRRRL